MKSNSGKNSRTRVPTSSQPILQTGSLFEQPKASGEPRFRIEIPGKLPSWNDILGMEQWKRYKFKNQLANVFLSVLRHSDETSLTKTTSAKSTTSTYCDTLESYLRTRQEKRRLKSLKKKSAKANENSSDLRFSEAPPF